MKVDFIDLKSQYQKIKKNVNQDFEQILESCHFILGPEVQKCEENLAKFSGAKYALSCGSGTDALILNLMALGIGAGDEVIVPGFTFFGSSEVINLVGATPVFAEVERSSYNICPNSVEKLITPKTKAVIAVGLFGQVAPMDELQGICDTANITLIEDAAQCFGGSYKGRRSGSLSKLASASFFPAKPLGCYGDGGAVFTDSEELYTIMKQLRVHGDQSRYDHIRIGINGRMDALQCAVINRKLEIFDWEIEQRNLVAGRYMEGLSDVSEIELPVIADHSTSVWAQFTVLLGEREKFRNAMTEHNIPTAIHYPKPVYKQPVYAKEYSGVKLNNCEYLANHVVSLPMHPYLKPEQQSYIIENIRKHFNA